MMIYIAGASAEPVRVRAAMNAVEALGYEITLDWLEGIENGAKANEGLTDLERRVFAGDDLDAVEEAAIVWLLAPSPPLASAGAWVEYGYALGLDKTVVLVSGLGRHKSIFASLCQEFDTDDEALAFLAAAKVDADALERLTK